MSALNDVQKRSIEPDSIDGLQNTGSIQVTTVGHFCTVSVRLIKATSAVAQQQINLNVGVTSKAYAMGVLRVAYIWKGVLVIAENSSTLSIYLDEAQNEVYGSIAFPI